MGVGHIGTVLTQELLHRGYFVRVLDNFMYGDYLEDNINLEKVIGDIRDKNLSRSGYRRYRLCNTFSMYI